MARQAMARARTSGPSGGTRLKPPSKPKSAAKAAPRKGSAPLTVSRPELLVDGSDLEFRRLVHGLFAFLARHEAIREGHGAYIGLAGVEYTVLIAISHLSGQGDVSVRTVADHLHLSGAFVTTVTNKLLLRGLVSKEEDPADRRRVCLRVTAAGGDLLEKLAPRLRQLNDVQFGCLNAREFHTLLTLVDRLVESSDRAFALQRYLSETEAEPRPTRRGKVA